ncbi:MAG: prepilin-type N-terminal cleavage/methylation domain-containing protein [Fimbriimonadaceae bacterium]|jgi:prepilin-type N-terminal cleavage/methylation domain-containing protein|nr:prepilin-type N-terminal cleavage/methylation domain-containing protein [Fimbriimonadaceae bacterium]
MKKAFTLIELLVVIAIIAILAAILFPVFAQAKTAAKKTAALSNQKQISTGFLLYMADNEDRYPMRSGCELNSSINSRLNDGVLRCSSGTGFGHSMTWQTWQKYIQPYIKNVDLFVHPLRTRDNTQWNTNGQILNSFAINLAVTGASVTGFNSTPWFGGSQTGLAAPSQTMLLMELPHSYAAPFAVSATMPAGEQTVYPMAIREYWRAIFLRNAGGCNTTEEIDPVAAPAGGLTVGFADGSAKFLQVRNFLGQTPTLNEYVPGAALPGPMGSNCRNARSAYNYTGGPSTPNINLNAPLWGLVNQ